MGTRRKWTALALSTPLYLTPSFTWNDVGRCGILISDSSGVCDRGGGILEGGCKDLRFLLILFAITVSSGRDVVVDVTVNMCGTIVVKLGLGRSQIMYTTPTTIAEFIAQRCALHFSSIR